MFTRILVPLDGSPLAEAVLPHAQNVATLCRAELLLLRVVVFPAPSMTLDDAGRAARYHDDLTQLRAAALAYVERMALVLRADGFVARAETREGNVGDEILSAAEARRCDLIAMSTHGRSGFQRLVLGSVAEGVLRHSDVPVLFFPRLSH